MKGPIQAVEVSYLLHATEDPVRVGNAVREVLGVDVRPEVEELEGHFGNKITRVRHHATGEAAGLVFSRLAARMPPAMKAELLEGLEGTVDEHSALYLRLDKQLLLAGGIAFASTDPVRLRVKPRLFMMKRGGSDFYRQVFGGGK